MPRTPIVIPTACLVALAAFVIALLSGLGTENPFSSIIQRALFALLVSWPCGFVLGVVLENYILQPHDSNQGEELEVTTEKRDTLQNETTSAFDNAQNEIDGNGVSSVTNEFAVGSHSASS